MKNNRQSESSKILRAIFTVALAGAFTLPLHGCNEEVPEISAMPVETPVDIPEDIPTETPAETPPESPVETRVPVEELDAIVKESVIVGGRLYDNWFSVSGTTAPTAENLLGKFMYGYSATAPSAPYAAFSALGKDKQYRCKTCHGFNYAGSDYFPVGIMDAADNMTVAEIQAVIKNGFTLSFGGAAATVVHDFGKEGLTDSAIAQLASFIKYGVVNVDEYFYPTFPVIGKGDSAKGLTLFQQTVGCGSNACHGSTGTARDFADRNPATFPNEFVGTIGQDDPAEMLHKIRFGQPSEARVKNSMPSIYDDATLTIQDAVDIMTYTQQLPRE